MGESLKGKRFFTCYNNGVSALASAEVVYGFDKHYYIKRNLKKDVSVGLAHIPETPIFTFVDMDRWGQSPWFTADTLVWDTVRRLIESNGGTHEGAQFYVPFSNGKEMGLHGDKEQINELRFVTSERQFLDTFGLTLREIAPQISRPQFKPM